MKRHVSMATSVKICFYACLYERWMRYNRWKEEKDSLFFVNGRLHAMVALYNFMCASYSGRKMEIY